MPKIYEAYEEKNPINKVQFETEQEAIDYANIKEWYLVRETEQTIGIVDEYPTEPNFLDWEF